MLLDERLNPWLTTKIDSAGNNEGQRTLRG